MSCFENIEGVRETQKLRTGYAIFAETLSRIKIDEKKLSVALDALRKSPEGACSLAYAVRGNYIDEARKIGEWYDRKQGDQQRNYGRKSSVTCLQMLSL
ncbi:MAG: hypothetical protein JW732_03305 [Dehalococcoidia bacterium]|nr:hypothetical protein [Dehalococcoidia bacterium]